MLTVDLGIMEFEQALAIQERVAEAVATGSGPETLLLLEHQPVYTLGRSGKPENILDPSIIPIEVNRGGDITYHGPGQVVGYPIISLDRRVRDLHRYLRFLEEFLITIATGFGVRSYRVEGKTGVWTDKGKIASIGIGVRRWVTMHGFALNVDPDMGAFAIINPCGIKQCPVTSLCAECGKPVTVGEVKEIVAERFNRLLNEKLPLTENQT